MDDDLTPDPGREGRAEHSRACEIPWKGNGVERNRDRVAQPPDNRRNFSPQPWKGEPIPTRTLATPIRNTLS